MRVSMIGVNASRLSFVTVYFHRPRLQSASTIRELSGRNSIV
jgi:hypothetical protein